MSSRSSRRMKSEHLSSLASPEIIEISDWCKGGEVVAYFEVIVYMCSSWVRLIFFHTVRVLCSVCGSSYLRWVLYIKYGIIHFVLLPFCRVSSCRWKGSIRSGSTVFQASSRRGGAPWESFTGPLQRSWTPSHGTPCRPLCSVSFSVRTCWWQAFSGIFFWRTES